MTGSIHLAVATHSPPVMHGIVKAIEARIELSARESLIVSLCDPEVDHIQSVPIIMEYARRNACKALQNPGAKIGAGYARGDAWVPYGKGAHLARFKLIVMISVAKDGVIAWSIPVGYPHIFDTELRLFCRRVFKRMDHSSAEPRLKAAAGIAVSTWSRMVEASMKYHDTVLD